MYALPLIIVGFITVAAVALLAVEKLSPLHLSFILEKDNQ